MAGLTKEQRAAKAAQLKEQPSLVLPEYPDCVFMYRDGKRAEVHTGSVAIMTALGWALKPHQITDAR